MVDTSKYSDAELEEIYAFLHNNWPVHVFNKGYTTFGKLGDTWEKAGDALRKIERPLYRRGLEKDDKLICQIYEKWLASLNH